MNLVVVLLLAGLCMVLGGLVAHTIDEHARAARDRRQADTQRHLNAATVQLARQVDELDVLIEQVRRLALPDREA